MQAVFDTTYGFDASKGPSKLLLLVRELSTVDDISTIPGKLTNGPVDSQEVSRILEYYSKKATKQAASLTGEAAADLLRTLLRMVYIKLSLLKSVGAAEKHLDASVLIQEMVQLLQENRPDVPGPRGASVGTSGARAPQPQPPPVQPLNAKPGPNAAASAANATAQPIAGRNAANAKSGPNAAASAANATAEPIAVRNAANAKSGPNAAASAANAIAQPIAGRNAANAKSGPNAAASAANGTAEPIAVRNAAKATAQSTAGHNAAADPARDSRLKQYLELLADDEEIDLSKEWPVDTAVDMHVGDLYRRLINVLIAEYSADNDEDMIDWSVELKHENIEGSSDLLYKKMQLKLEVLLTAWDVFKEVIPPELPATVPRLDEITGETNTKQSERERIALKVFIDNEQASKTFADDKPQEETRDALVEFFVKKYVRSIAASSLSNFKQFNKNLEDAWLQTMGIKDELEMQLITAYLLGINVLANIADPSIDPRNAIYSYDAYLKMFTKSFCEYHVVSKAKANT